jgi:hypothetical protein
MRFVEGREPFMMHQTEQETFQATSPSQEGLDDLPPEPPHQNTHLLILRRRQEFVHLRF